MRILKRALVGAFLLQSVVTAAEARDLFIGEIFLFGGNFCPRGTAAAEGQLLSISQNAALFSLLGTIYGGDGRTTFGLPDLRGRAPLGQGSGVGLPTYRQGQFSSLGSQSGPAAGGFIAMRYCVALEGIFPSRG
ncbi:MAG: tail fiber protein [Pseudomonadota bacterium]